MLNAFQKHLLLPNWNVQSNSVPPTDLHVLAPGGAGIPTELIFSLLLRKNSFICSESHWMLSVALWLCSSWSLSLPRIYHRIIRKQKLEDIYRREHEFPWFSWNKSLWVQLRFYTNERGLQNLEQHICICILWLRGEWAPWLGEVPGS